MVPSLINFDNNIRTNSWDNIVEQYSLKRDEMKNLFENRCVKECNNQCGNTKKGLNRITLFDNRPKLETK